MRQGIELNSVPQTAATTFVFSSVFILLLWPDGSAHFWPKSRVEEVQFARKLGFQCRKPGVTAINASLCYPYSGQGLTEKWFLQNLVHKLPVAQASGYGKT